MMEHAYSPDAYSQRKNNLRRKYIPVINFDTYEIKQTAKKMPKVDVEDLFERKLKINQLKMIDDHYVIEFSSIDSELTVAYREVNPGGKSLIQNFILRK